MRLRDLEAKMRVYEADSEVLPGLQIIARLDGRGCTRLVQEVLQYEQPFDERFKTLMVDVTRHLVKNSGFRVVYGYTKSDEISLLLHAHDATFGRRARKLISVLAGEASAHASLELQKRLAFDCRLSQLPSQVKVLDYFRWRQEDAKRNALSGHCYHALLSAGHSPRHAHKMMRGVDGLGKERILGDLQVDFNSTPLWQHRGVGVYWEGPQASTESRCAIKYTQFRTEVPGSDADRTLTVYRGLGDAWVLRSVSMKNGSVLADDYYDITGTPQVSTAPLVLWEHEVPKPVVSDIWRYWVPYDTIKMTQVPNVWGTARPDLIMNEQLPCGPAYVAMLDNLIGRSV